MMALWGHILTAVRVILILMSISTDVSGNETEPVRLLYTGTTQTQRGGLMEMNLDIFSGAFLLKHDWSEKTLYFAVCYAELTLFVTKSVSVGH